MLPITLTLPKFFTGSQNQFTRMNEDHSRRLISRDSPVMDESVVTKRMAVWELYFQWLKGEQEMLAAIKFYAYYVSVCINIYVHAYAHTHIQTYN